MWNYWSPNNINWTDYVSTVVIFWYILITHNNFDLYSAIFESIMALKFGLVEIFHVKNGRQRSQCIKKVKTKNSARLYVNKKKLKWFENHRNTKKFYFISFMVLLTKLSIHFHFFFFSFVTFFISVRNTSSRVLSFAGEEAKKFRIKN